MSKTTNAVNTTSSKSSAKKSKNKKSGSGSEENNEKYRELLLESLKDIYYAEKYLLKALPKMQKASTSKDLAAAFEKHIKVTEKQVDRLEQVFEILEEPAKSKKCDAMIGLVEEANSVIKDTDKGTLIRDAALIIAAQKVEHYEIATYGSLRVMAANLRQNEIERLLSDTLQEEKDADVSLTVLAEGHINNEALAE